MNKLFEQFTEDIKAKFSAAFGTEDFIKFLEKTKSASDSGTFKVIISTPAVDRQGESVDQNLWDLNNYNHNPVVLWSHDYSSLPIGIATSIEKQIIDSQVVLVAEGKFAPAEANPFAQQVRTLYESGIVRATSVGFIPASARMDGQSAKGNELLEFSFVPVPANPQALSLSQAQKLGLDLSLLAIKGIIFEEKTSETKQKEADVPETEEKSGRALSKANRGQIQQAIDALKATAGALETMLEASDIQGDEGKDSPDGGSPKQRSVPAGSFDDWKFSREVLRAIVTSGSEALERFNKIARANADRK